MTRHGARLARACREVIAEAVLDDRRLRRVEVDVRARLRAAGAGPRQLRAATTHVNWACNLVRERGAGELILVEHIPLVAAAGGQGCPAVVISGPGSQVELIHFSFARAPGMDDLEALADRESPGLFRTLAMTVDLPERVIATIAHPPSRTVVSTDLDRDQVLASWLSAERVLERASTAA